MNYIKEIVEKVLPVGIGEEFNIILDHGGYSTHNPFKFTETDLVNNDGDNLNNYISNLMIGYYTIEKIPFVPKVGEDYWSYYNDDDSPFRGLGICKTWNGSHLDKMRKLLGIVFRTEQEAKDYLPTWQKRLKGEEL